MNLAQKVLLALGASRVFKVDQFEDPQTEEEFKALEYESKNTITWEMYQQKYPEIEQKFGVKYLRDIRNQLLRDTDWIMTADNYASLANKEEWVAYRQALRDLPTNPPVFKWKDMTLNIEAMNLPIRPPVTRMSNSTT